MTDEELKLIRLAVLMLLNRINRYGDFNISFDDACKLREIADKLIELDRNKVGDT